MMIRDDHIHTNYSDGKDSPEEMVRCAIELGYSGITFTDHVRRNSDWVIDYYNEIDSLREKYKKKLQIEIGVEAKVLDFFGTIDCPDIIIDDDRIEKIAAIHRVPCGNGKFIRKENIAQDSKSAFESYVKAIKGLRNNKCVNRIAHPFSLFENFGINEKDKRWDYIIGAIEESRKSLEYNVKYNNKVVPDEVWLFFNDRLVVGSDSHSVEELAERMDDIKRFDKEWIRGKSI